MSGLDTSNPFGHLAAWNDFQSADTPVNKAWIDQWQALTKNDKRPANLPMDLLRFGINMWVNAVTAAGTVDVDPMLDALIGQKFPNLTCGLAELLPSHPLTKSVLIREVKADGQFDTISQTDPVPGNACPDYLKEPAVQEPAVQEPAVPEASVPKPALDPRAALTPLVAITRMATNEAPQGKTLAREIKLGRDLTAVESWDVLVPDGSTPARMTHDEQEKAVVAHIEAGSITGFPLSDRAIQANRDRADTALEIAGQVPPAATDDKVVAAITAQRFHEVHIEAEPIASINLAV